MRTLSVWERLAYARRLRDPETRRRALHLSKSIEEQRDVIATLRQILAESEGMNDPPDFVEMIESTLRSALEERDRMHADFRTLITSSD